MATRIEAATIEQLVSVFGFPPDRSRQAVAAIGDKSDVQLAYNWLLDHGEDDRGGPIQVKICEHADRAGACFVNPKNFVTEPFESLKCSEGCSSGEVWLCLCCGEVRCSRYVKGHNLDHFKQTQSDEEAALTVAEASVGKVALGHFAAIGLRDLSVWCYHCSAYVTSPPIEVIKRRLEKVKFGKAEGSSDRETGATKAEAAARSVSNALAEDSFLGAGFGSAPRPLRAADFGLKLPKEEELVPGDCCRRQKVLLETLARLEEASPTARYHGLARANMLRWKEEAGKKGTTDDGGADSACRVIVLPGDWGDVTLRMTKQFGATFAVLNMANAYSPGGGYTHDCVAQEENMFRRTDCHFSLDRSAVFDPITERYLPAVSGLINAAEGRVLLDASRPRVCIRGPEDRTKSDLGYDWLPDDEIFPFYELRSAALDLRTGRPFDPNEMARRIGAQLDTLVECGVRHAVLSAFGCGAFLNPAEVIAGLYRRELSRRATDFDVVAFGIFHAGYGPNNFEPFADVFSNWPEDLATSTVEAKEKD